MKHHHIRYSSVSPIRRRRELTSYLFIFIIVGHHETIPAISSADMRQPATVSVTTDSTAGPAIEPSAPKKKTLSVKVKLLCLAFRFEILSHIGD